MSIFAKIIAGEIPSHRVHEDAQTFAFLDIHPLSRGHTLLIPREPAATLGELSEASAAALGRVLPRLCRAIVRATGCPGYNVLQNNGAVAGQVVMHAHLHIIPRYEGDGLGAGLAVTWRAGKLDPAAGADLARAIQAGL